MRITRTTRAPVFPLVRIPFIRVASAILRTYPEYERERLRWATRIATLETWRYSEGFRSAAGDPTITLNQFQGFGSIALALWDNSRVRVHGQCDSASRRLEIDRRLNAQLSVFGAPCEHRRLHDIPCPWCRIGKANLESALRQWDGEFVTITWRPFLLDRGVPATGTPASDFYRIKFGAENVEPMFERVRAAGRRAGVEFAFEDAIRAPSEDAHRLIWLTPEEAKTAVVDGLQRAYFNEGRNIADLETLADVAATAGLDREIMLARLKSGEGSTETSEAIENAYRAGVTGVPFFVFDNRYALSGAQPPETILAAMRQTVRDRLTAEPQRDER